MLSRKSLSPSLDLGGKESVAKFSDNYPDITPPNVVSGGFTFDHPMENEWDYYLASVFGDVETLTRIRAANPQINGTMHYEFPLIMAVRNGRTDAVRFLLEAEDRNIDGEPPTNDNVWYSRCIDAAKKRGFDEIHAMLLETRARAEAHAMSQPPDRIDKTLEITLTEGDVSAVKRLLAEKELTAAPSDDQTQYLQWAYETEAKEKQVELVRAADRPWFRSERRQAGLPSVASEQCPAGEIAA